MESQPPSAPATGQTNFFQRLGIVTFSLILVYLVIYFLREFRGIFQPLFIAVFAGYLILPVHTWLVQRGIRSTLAYFVMLVLLLLVLFGIGSLVYANMTQLFDRLPAYAEKLEGLIKDSAQSLGLDEETLLTYYREFVSPQDRPVEQSVAQLRQTLGNFLNFFSMFGVTCIYLVFLFAEKVSFSKRINRAFGDAEGQRIQEIVGTINAAISQYIAVKTFISLLAGALSMLVLAVFRVDFYITWGLLIFLFNFIPYIGSIVAVALPIVLSFLQLGVWQGIVVTALLIAIQEVIALAIEPRMAGNRLGVSPLLILLSLAFWGVVWGIVGMILAVPLLVVIKICLENIKETQPLARLMSNV